MMTRGGFLFPSRQQKNSGGGGVQRESPNLSRFVHFARWMLSNPVPRIREHPFVKSVGGERGNFGTNMKQPSLGRLPEFADVINGSPLYRVGVCVLTPGFKEVINVC